MIQYYLYEFIDSWKEDVLEMYPIDLKELINWEVETDIFCAASHFCRINWAKLIISSSKYISGYQKSQLYT